MDSALLVDSKVRDHLGNLFRDNAADGLGLGYKSMAKFTLSVNLLTAVAVIVLPPRHRGFVVCRGWRVDLSQSGENS
jgi:hypothetical protein